ncbi:MAG TPA: hypothetical protein PLL69_09290, partial [Gemmatimonadales bacterium]|nr:hypothetical protein [Gemmatimonadales bacterium]
RLAHSAERRRRAEAERGDLELRAQHARIEQESAAADLAIAESELGRIQEELAARNAVEQAGRDRLAAERDSLRATEQALQQHAELHRRLAGEQGALDAELNSLGERIAQEEAHREQLATDHQQTSERLAEAREVADTRSDEFRRGSAAAEQARLL